MPESKIKNPGGDEARQRRQESKLRRRLQRYIHFDFSTLRFALCGGFTLLETIIALGVITSAIVGPYTLATRAILSVAGSKNKLIAINLAQEGIELVRKIRDDNVLAGRAWDTGIGSGTWQIDVLSDSLTPFISGVPLRYDALSGLYTAGAGDLSIFTRSIVIEKPPVVTTPGIPNTDPVTGLPTQMRITATVSWTESTVSKRVTLQETIYDWK